jgi:magnesium chelatase family protein
MIGLARERGFHSAYVPEEDAAEASLVEGIDVIPVPNIVHLAAHLRGFDQIEPFVPKQRFESGDCGTGGRRRLPHIRGQEHVKRALEVAASGGHNVIMVGPPGSEDAAGPRDADSPAADDGDEALEVTKIYSVAGMLPQGTPMIHARPFGRRTTRCRTRDSSAAGGSLARARSLCLIGACCSWTSCRSSGGRCWSRSGSRWRTGW